MTAETNQQKSEKVRSLALTTARLPLHSLPANAYLVHSTNCLGIWGAGIAQQLADMFPAACSTYKAFCLETKDGTTPWPSRSLAGRALIIPPQQADVAAGAPRVHIVCLFTSYGYGSTNKATGKPGKDTTAKILEQTDRALEEFRSQLDGLAGTIQRESAREAVPVIYSPRFNAGAFHVPWERTVQVIERVFEGWEGCWVVLEPPT